jgi:peptide/nickel transport system substrate-binding protein
MYRRLLTASCGLAILFAASAFAFPARAQTLRIALREDPDILDPTLAGTYVGRIVFAGLCDKLFDIDEKLQIVPQLALGYEWSDPKTLVLHLRPNVTFQDGEPFDAAAVKYTMEHYQTFPGSYRRGEIGMIDHVEVVDPLTARLVLKSPSAPLMSLFTDRSGMILPPKATEAAGKDFGLHPVCTGPFKFTERVAQDHITLDRYPGYWDNANIHFDRVIYQPMSDPAVELANLHTGNIDLAERVLPSDVSEVKKDPKLRIITSPALGYNSIIFNVANGDRAKTPLGQNALLRQAFEAAIDRQALVDVVYNSMYQPTAQAVTPASPLYVKGFEPTPRDIDKAKALVKQSGIPTPIPVTIMVPNVPDATQLAEVIQSMVHDAGFELKINPVDTAASLSAGQQGNFETYTIGWSGRPDPDGNLYVFLHSAINQNYGHYNSPVVDSALEAARTVTDPTARLAEYSKMMTQLRQDMPVIYLYHPVNIVGMQAKLTGFRPVPDGLIRLQGLSAAK